ncbi:MAG TPA: hypothetical protein VEC12_09660 [Bacteroidia bacterium]|nr:hypothetical protein [Bacteroidia bacterium]
MGQERVEGLWVLVGVQNFEPLPGRNITIYDDNGEGFKTDVTAGRQVVTGVEAGRNSRNTIF